MSPKKIIVHPIAFLRDAVKDEETRVLVTRFVVYTLLMVVSATMAIINFSSGYTATGWTTLAFSLACLLFDGLLYFFRNLLKFTGFLFACSVIALFSFLLVTGVPNGFSAIWIAMLPSFGLLLFGIKRGAIFTGLMWLVLIFFLWIPAGRNLLQYPYEDAFCQRFPLLYLAFFAMAAIFETIRLLTYKELESTRNRYEYLYRHDALTHVYNRYGFQEMLSTKYTHDVSHTGLAIFDIDFFKSINDVYGHQNGDKILEEIAGIATDIVGEEGTVSRWGGEEFTIFFSDDASATHLCETLRKEIENHDFAIANTKVRLTISIGLVLIPGGIKPGTHEAVYQADANLYRAKETGRNKVVQSYYEEAVQAKPEE